MGNWTTVSSPPEVAPIPPALPSSIALSEVGPRVLVAPANTTQTTLRLAWTDPGSGPAPLAANYVLNVPAGVAGAAGESTVMSAGTTRYIEFAAWAPATDQGWSATLNLIAASGATSAAVMCSWIWRRRRTC